jgi:DNA-binding SARP family transcriptional activator
VKLTEAQRQEAVRVGPFIVLACADEQAQQRMAEDPTNENLLCHLMQTLHEAGMTHQALRAYEEFAKSLKKAGLEPAEMTTALYRHLKRAPRGLALSALSTTAPSSLPSSSLADPQQENASQARDTTESGSSAKKVWPVA